MRPRIPLSRRFHQVLFRPDEDKSSRPGTGNSLPRQELPLGRKRDSGDDTQEEEAIRLAFATGNGALRPAPSLERRMHSFLLDTIRRGSQRLDAPKNRESLMVGRSPLEEP